MGPDWGLGQYEKTATELLPAARQLVDAARVGPGVQVADIGCGTGTVALLAAEAGAVVTAVEPSPRLLEVAAAAAAERGHAITFRQGAAPGLPLADAAVDVVTSNFAVIFSTDPEGAVADLLRVTRPDGRVVISAWIPGGAMDKAIAALMRRVAEITGQSGGDGRRFSWHETDSLRAAVTATGSTWTVTTTTHSIAFRGTSAADYYDEIHAVHPMSLIAIEGIRQAGGDPDEARELMVNVLDEHNEDPTEFQITSRYVIHTIEAM